MVPFSLNLLFIRYLGKKDQIWAKVFCIPKNVHSRTLMLLLTFLLKTILALIFFKRRKLS